jgi:hypothetical protein
MPALQNENASLVARRSTERENYTAAMMRIKLKKSGQKKRREEKRREEKRREEKRREELKLAELRRP